MKDKGLKRKISEYGSRNKDNIRLAFSDPEFGKRIQEIRSYLEIPEGLYGDSESKDEDQSIEAWFNKLLHKENAEELINYFTASIQEIIKDFNYPDNWFETIRQYIITGEIKKLPGLPFSIKPTVGNRAVQLTINNKLTDKDWLTIKEFTNKFFGKRLFSNKKIKDLDRKLAIKDQWENKRIYFDYGDQEYITRTSEDIADFIEDKTGKRPSKSEIYNISDQIKKIRDRVFKKFIKK
ncbi:MAG: hypothetical protein WD312_01900 [Candidatus Paceibacterota bacterium]